MLAKTYGSAIFGINATTITIEVNVIQGAKFYMVGLPDNAVKESQQRVESALKFFGYNMPRQKTVINLAPADIRKEGAAYDLPIALGILKASNQMNETISMEKYIIMGELSLDGIVRPIKGVLPIAIEAKKQGFKGMLLPKENASEATVVNDFSVISIATLKDAIDFFEEGKSVQTKTFGVSEFFRQQQNRLGLDFADVQGQENVKRALEIAAAGAHNIILIGPPGSGKTMLAKRLPSILPPLTLDESLETTKIHSVSGKLTNGHFLIHERPFRSPHHTISDVALVGGGSVPQPGEISLAHNGILFLDELPEFKRTVLEVMRQPLEDRIVNVSRAKGNVKFPANFMLVASMNPSPSGTFFINDGTHPDSEMDVRRYLKKISGPLLDRIDLHIEVSPVSFDDMTANKKSENSKEIRKRIISAREKQKDRFKNKKGIHSNSMMPAQLIKKTCIIDEVGKALLKTAMEKLNLSARAYDRILKVARTIADLENSNKIEIAHLSEAIQYRSFDRNNWMDY